MTSIAPEMRVVTQTTVKSQAMPYRNHIPVSLVMYARKYATIVMANMMVLGIVALLVVIVVWEGS